MKAPSPMLQDSPTTAFFITWAKAQIRVPAPTRSDSLRPWGWTNTSANATTSIHVGGLRAARDRCLARGPAAVANGPRVAQAAARSHAQLTAREIVFCLPQPCPRILASHGGMRPDPLAGQPHLPVGERAARDGRPHTRVRPAANP